MYSNNQKCSPGHLGDIPIGPTMYLKKLKQLRSAKLNTRCTTRLNQIEKAEM